LGVAWLSAMAVDAMEARASAAVARAMLFMAYLRNGLDGRQLGVTVRQVIRRSSRYGYSAAEKC
ncbi:hypothetical protein NNX13_27835, partial [Pseudomonas sp. Eb3]|uniref:hypothetical protein n=1 Tax=Pseudomonas sp. Eb3 TaxID=1327558 RepID=UPI00210384F5